MQENSMGVAEVRSTIMELQNGIDEKFEQNIEKRLTEMENVIAVFHGKTWRTPNNS